MNTFDDTTVICTLPCQRDGNTKSYVVELEETLKIIMLEERFRTSIDLLKCNRMVRLNLCPRLRKLVSRGWQRISAFFNPGQSIADLEMMAQAESVREIKSQEIGEICYCNDTITIVATLDHLGRPVAQAYIHGATDLIYGTDITSKLAVGGNVTEVIARAKQEINHRRSVLELIEKL